MPGGYEFASLIHAIKMVSSKSSALSTETKEQLKTLSKPLHIQVFVTLTCSYCPTAVQIAHGMALESPLVISDMVEVVLDVGGIFIEIGAIPNVEFAKDVVKLNALKEIEVDCDCKTRAAGEGAKAALSAYRYLIES